MPIRSLAVGLAFVAAVAALTLPRSVFAAPGDLDPAWDGDGLVTTTAPGGTGHEVHSVAVQPSDGYVVAVGYAVVAGARQFMVVRYDTTGALDPTFGGGTGIVVTTIGVYSDATGVAIQPSDGAIVVTGCTGMFACTDFVVARYDSAGILDPTFDGDGIVTTSISGGSNPEGATAVAVDPVTGAIVVAGSTIVSTKDFAVIRYTSAGAPDVTFGGGDGIVTTDIPGGFGTLEDVASGVAVQSDGKIVAAGRSNTGVSFARYVVVRYEADGDLDPTFNGDGIFAGNTSGNPDAFGSMALQPDGMILAATTINSIPSADLGAARLSAIDGTLDTAFSGDGFALADIGSTPNVGNALAVDSAARIVVVGSAGPPFPPSSLNPALVRFDSTGTLDATFGIGGKVQTVIASSYANSVVIQSDDKIVVGISGTFTVLRYDGGPAVTTPTPTPTETPTPTLTATPTATLTPPCPPLPIAGCRTPALPAKAYLSTLDKSDDTKDQFQWKWLKGSVTMKADFGNPVTTTQYQLCVYDSANVVLHDATIAPGGTCSLANPRPCWKDKSNGFDFKDKDRAQSGIEQISLRQGLIAGKASIQIKGKGPLLDDPAYTFAQPITVQLSNGSVCWEAVYSAPASQNTVGPPAKFKDKAD